MTNFLDILITIPLWIMAWHIRQQTRDSQQVYKESRERFNLHDQMQDEMHAIFKRKNAEFLPAHYDVSVSEHLTSDDWNGDH